MLAFGEWLYESCPEFFSEMAKPSGDRCKTKRMIQAVQRTPCLMVPGGSHEKVMTPEGEFVTPIPRHREVENGRVCNDIWKRLAAKCGATP